MANLKFQNVEEYISQLEKLYAVTDKTIEKTVDAGAGIVADAVRGSINSLPVDDRKYVPSGELRQGIRSLQLAGLQNSFGITPIRDDHGFINRKIGFDGYNHMVTKKWPKGQPNSMIARSINSGTTFLRKTSFMDTAVRSSKAAAEEKMRRTLDNEVKSIFN